MTHPSERMECTPDGPRYESDVRRNDETRPIDTRAVREENDRRNEDIKVVNELRAALAEEISDLFEQDYKIRLDDVA